MQVSSRKRCPHPEQFMKNLSLAAGGIMVCTLFLLLGGCGGEGGGGTSPSTTIDSEKARKSGSRVGHTVAEIARVARGSLVLQGKLRPDAYPSSNLSSDLKKPRRSPLATSAPCPLITEPETLSSSFIIVIDYGTGCVDSFDGIRRGGKITVAVTEATVDLADKITSGVITLAFTSYTVGQNILGGSASIHVASSTSESWDMSLTLSKPTETQALVFQATVSYSDSTDVETVEGSGTFISSKDGSIDFSLNNLQYDFDTTHTPLTCPNPIGGSITLSTASRRATLTFGVPTPGCGSAFLSLDGGADFVVSLEEASDDPASAISDSVPPAPTGLSVTSENGQIVARWNSVEGATSYNLYKATLNGVSKNNYTQLLDGKRHADVSSPFILTDLRGMEHYYFVVTAVNGKGESEDSKQFTLLPWIARASGTSNTLLGIASSGSEVVAVGALGTIVSSSDGISWTSRSSNINFHLYGVASSENQFVAVGEFGTILTSSDSVAWTAQTSGTSHRLRGVGWTGSQFISVGEGGTILTSPDGVSWTQQASGTTNELYGVAAHGTQIVAVGAANTILTSPTGTGWTTKTSAGGGTLRSIIWTGTQFLIGGDGNNFSNVQTSFDGMTWTRRDPAWGNEVYGVSWSGTQFLTVGTSSTTQTSTDGVSWTFGPSIGIAKNLHSVTWFNKQFILTGGDGLIITVAPYSEPAKTLFSIASSGSHVIAVGALGTVLTSSDAVSWTSRATNVASHLFGVASSGTQTVAVGDSGTILTSNDLVTWTTRTSGTTRRLRGVAWVGSQFVSVGDAGIILTSPNGFSWAEQVSGTTDDLYAVAGNDAQIVAVGAAETILSSPTGTAWTSRRSGGSETIHSIIWSGTQFLTVGHSPIIYTSFDGLSWSGQSSRSGGMHDVAWSGTLFLAVGFSGGTQSSADGISWQWGTFFERGKTHNAVIWFNDQFVIVGEEGFIYRLSLPLPEEVFS